MKEPRLEYDRFHPFNEILRDGLIDGDLKRHFERGEFDYQSLMLIQISRLLTQISRQIIERDLKENKENP